MPLPDLCFGGVYRRAIADTPLGYEITTGGSV